MKLVDGRQVLEGLKDIGHDPGTQYQFLATAVLLGVVLPGVMPLM
jgi:hypothetical protein